MCTSFATHTHTAKLDRTRKRDKFIIIMKEFYTLYTYISMAPPHFLKDLSIFAFQI